MRFTRRASIIAAGSVLALTLAACGSSALSDDSDSTGDADQSTSSAAGNEETSSSAPQAGDKTITIGLLTAETGTYASLGKEMKRAADLYLKQNDNKMGDLTVELVTGDSASDPETGTTKAKELVLKDHVDVIAGIIASPVAVSVATVAESNEVPIVIANAGANTLTGENASPYVWRVSQSNYQHGYAAGAYIAQHVSKSGGVFMGADYSAGTETRDGFLAGYQDNGGGDLLAEILTPFGSTQNYQPFLSQIPDDASFVYAFYAGGEAITFEKNYDEFGYKDKFPLYGAQNLTDEDVLPALGDAAVGVYTVGLYAPALDNPTNKTFSAEWEKQYDAKPSIIAATTYDAFNFIGQAAKIAGADVDAASLTEAFASVGDIDSPRGKFTIDPATHNPVQDYYVRKLEKDGDDYVNTVIATVPDVKG